ncbi:hypothetical protein JCM10296v2_000446 [Rhodotorula toruloides]
MLKRSKSLADFFRPSRSPSPAPAPPPRPAPASSADTDAYSRRDPFGDASTSPSHSRQAPPPLDTSFVRSGTVDDILGAYGDSPTKTRQPPLPERFDSSYTTSSSVSASTSRDEIAEMVPVLDRRDDVATATNGALRSSQRSARSRPGGPQTRSRSNTDLDLIDRLDISGLYGGGGLMRHEGPYAAASTSRNQGNHAPIAAFDPSAFSLGPSPSRTPPPPSASSMRRKVSNGLSERAQATLAAMDENRDITLGYPGGRKGSAKNQQLLEIYGMRDAEAWEEYGQARYEPGGSATASRESVVPNGETGETAKRSKEDRMQRTQSIWDIEATLKAGKPVGATAPPPIPVIPADWNAPDVSPSNKPKRSKSLAARFRAGRKNPNNPLTDDTTVVTCAEDGREAAQAHSVPVSPVEERRPYRDWPASSPLSLNGSRGPSAGMDGGVEQLEVRTAAIKFDENGLSAPMSRTATDDGSVTASPTTGKKEKGGLKRLFSTKRKG